MQPKTAKSFLIDMDGVLVRGNNLIPGADQFIDRLKSANRKFLILTNNSERTPQDLQHRLQKIGLNVTADHLYTSALATARFLSSQKPKGTAFVIGGSGLIEALHDVGYAQHIKLLTHLQANGQPPLVLDSRETLRNPANVLQKSAWNPCT